MRFEYPLEDARLDRVGKSAEEAPVAVHAKGDG